MESKTIPTDIMQDVKFIQDNDQKLKEAKSRVLAYTQANGDIIDLVDNIKVSAAKRTTSTLKKSEISDYRVAKVVKIVREGINSSNVLDYAKTDDLKRAGISAEATPELYNTSITEYVKITGIPKGARE